MCYSIIKERERDKLKKKICDENGITVIYISLDPHVVKYSSENMEILKTIFLIPLLK